VLLRLATRVGEQRFRLCERKLNRDYAYLGSTDLWQVRNNKDKKRICLANRIFRDLMVVRLWQHVTTDLCPTATKSFDALIHPNSNIVRNLKYFTLTNSNESLDFANDQREMFILLMLALLRDKLVRFESFVRFDSNAFKILVQAQRQLEDIDVLLGNAVQDTTSLVPYLTAVNDITVWIDRDAARAASTFQNYESLLQHTPQLASMAIVASRTDDPQMPGYDADISLIKFLQVNNKIGRLDLRDLELVDLLLGSH
jgi:hypothetical protein